MKVVFIGTYNAKEILTGPEKVCKRIFEEYSRTDKTLFVQYFQDGKKFGYLRKLFGYEKTTNVNGSDVIMVGIVRMLFEILKNNPKVLHILNFNRFVVFLYLLKIISRINIFYTLNGIIRHENKYYKKESLYVRTLNILTENVLIYLSDKIFYLSDFAKGILNLYYSPDKNKLAKALNGLDKCFLGQNIYSATDREINSLVFIGNINQKEKGFSFLLKILKEIDVKINLYIIDSLENANGLPKFNNPEIIFVDRMLPENMMVFLKDKRLLFTPSEYDIFNISSLEAISCGLYPFLSKQSGISELTGKYFSACVFEYGNFNAALKALKNSFNSKLSFQSSNELKLLSWKNILNNYYMPYYD
jgi:glycosyltransferase involved in cell wall biosynthesis